MKKLLFIFVLMLVSSLSLSFANVFPYKNISSPIFGGTLGTYIDDIDYDLSGEACVVGTQRTDGNGGVVVFGDPRVSGNNFMTNDRLDWGDVIPDDQWENSSRSHSTFVARLDVNGNLRSWNLISPAASLGNIAATRFGCHVYVSREENRRYAIGRFGSSDYTYHSGQLLLQLSASSGKLNWTKSTVEPLPTGTSGSGYDRYLTLHRLRSLPDYVLSVGKSQAIAHGPKGELSSIRMSWPSCTTVRNVESTTKGHIFFEMKTESSGCVLGKFNLNKGPSILRYNLQLKAWDHLISQEELVGIDYKERLVTKKIISEPKRIEIFRRYEPSLISVYEKQLDLLGSNYSSLVYFKNNFAGKFLWRHGGCYNSSTITYKLVSGETKVHQCSVDETLLMKMDENFNIINLNRYNIVDSTKHVISEGGVPHTLIAYSAKTDSMLFTISTDSGQSWGIKSLVDSLDFFPEYPFERYNHGPLILILSTQEKPL